MTYPLPTTTHISLPPHMSPLRLTAAAADMLADDDGIIPAHPQEPRPSCCRRLVGENPRQIRTGLHEKSYFVAMKARFSGIETLLNNIFRTTISYMQFSNKPIDNETCQKISNTFNPSLNEMYELFKNWELILDPKELAEDSKQKVLKETKQIAKQTLEKLEALNKELQEMINHPDHNLWICFQNS